MKTKRKNVTTSLKTTINIRVHLKVSALENYSSEKEGIFLNN
jgi:hypothetical protein